MMKSKYYSLAKQQLAGNMLTVLLKDVVNQDHCQILWHNKKRCKTEKRDEITNRKNQTE